VAEVVVRIEEHQYDEVGQIAPDAADREAGSGSVVDGSCRAAPVKPLQVHGAVRLEFGDRIHPIIL
jgi:hypothetical protein